LRLLSQHKQWPGCPKETHSHQPEASTRTVWHTCWMPSVRKNTKPSGFRN